MVIQRLNPVFGQKLNLFPRSQVGEDQRVYHLNIFTTIAVLNFLSKFVNYLNITQQEQKHGFCGNMPMKLHR
jgi:hypothetical protein